ncbi:hypothetical protein BGX20_007394 [Mortierella sp. AD010]|nr:hypothetical protein BGX20_007394 [Mortierella sp. AD010]
MTSDLDNRINGEARSRRSFKNIGKALFMTFAGQSHTPADIDELESAYRILPLIFGCIIPVSILINVPSLTSPWVGQQQYNPQTGLNEIVTIPIPRWIEAMVAIALIMAVICNLCVLSRFLERNIWHSVVLSLITATLQDVLSVGAIIPFCLMYRPSAGYYYLEGFWTMIASMIFSLTATAIMSIDFHCTPNFRLQGSGVTHKQRMLIAQAMALCFYLAFGALVMIWIEHWTFLDALFFGMVTITTIGFGDTTAKTSGGRVFVVFYGAGGIILFAMAINAIRYVILEDLHRQFAIRAKERKAKKDARKRERKEQRLLEQEQQRQRFRETLERMSSLENQSETNTVNGTGHRHHFPILHNLTLQHGSTILSLFSRSTPDSPESKSRNHSVPPPVNELFAGVGGVKNEPKLLGNFQRGACESRKEVSCTAAPGVDGMTDHPIEDNTCLSTPRDSASEKDTKSLHSNEGIAVKSHRLSLVWLQLRRFCGLKTASPIEIAAPCQTLKEQREADRKLAYQESMEEYSRRLRLSFIMFMSFWLIGAGIFQVIESWSYGEAMYFCFVAFSSIGYGDVVPHTLAGRSIFLVYCLVGVGALTSLASLISEVISKTMRRHVVETQIRRNERFLRLGVLQRRTSDTDLEQGYVVGGEEGAENEFSSDDGSRQQRVQNIHGIVGQEVPVGGDEGDTPSDQRACRGSLQNLVQVTRDFDSLLQKVLGRDYQKTEGSFPSASASAYDANHTKEQSIYDYLEKEEDEDSAYLPSISRDVTSTSTIQRRAVNALGSLGRFRNIKPEGTYHGDSSPLSESRFNITAWPSSTPSTNSNTATDKSKLRPPGTNNLYHAPPSERHRQQLQQRFDHPSRPSSAQGTSPSHHHNNDGSVTISVAHWQKLIEYSATFRTLTDTCEETLKRFLAWEANEKKKSQRRRKSKDRRKRLMQERKRRFFELGGRFGAIDDGIEDEEELEEELDEWDEEGSIEEYDGANDEALDRHRELIANALLGTERPTDYHQSGHSNRVRRPGITTRPSYQARMDLIQKSNVHHIPIDVSTDDSSATVVPALVDEHTQTNRQSHRRPHEKERAGPRGRSLGKIRARSRGRSASRNREEVAPSCSQNEQPTGRSQSADSYTISISNPQQDTPGREGPSGGAKH